MAKVFSVLSQRLVERGRPSFLAIPLKRLVSEPLALVASLIAGTDLICPTAPVLRVVKQHEQFFNVASRDPKD
jgi:hypothetical protein